jgi:hypothetical protein
METTTKKPRFSKHARQDDHFDSQNGTIIDEFIKEMSRDSVGTRDRVYKKIVNNEIDLRTLSMNVYFLSFRQELT